MTNAARCFALQKEILSIHVLGQNGEKNVVFFPRDVSNIEYTCIHVHVYTILVMVGYWSSQFS